VRKPKEARIQRNAANLRHDQTDAENALWKELRMHQLNDVHFRRQHPIGHYIVDFCSPMKKLVIEVDGGQHLEQKAYDQRRTEFLEKQGYRMLRFWDHEVLTEIEKVLQVIYDTTGEEMEDPEPEPPPASPV
jgi:adenine-specific DNA-methyltransferase